MLLNPYRPFRFRKRFVTEDYNNDYVNYTIEFGRHNPDITTINQWVTIYKGKSLVIDKETTIELSSVIVDYVKRSSFNYDWTQGFEPSNIIKPLEKLTTIEMLGDIANTQVRVSFISEIEVIDRDVFEFNIYNDRDKSPYTERMNNVVLYSNQNIVNHIPLIETKNYWISIDFGKYAGGEDVAPIIFTDDNDNQLKLNTTGTYGNYSVSIPLAGLYEYISGDEADVITIFGTNTADRYIGGTAAFGGAVLGVPMGARNAGGGDVLTDGTKVDFGYSVGQSTTIDNAGNIAVVDACPSDWYMAWTDLNGWHSVALSSVWEIDNREAFTIKNIYDETRNIKNTLAKTFNVKSKKLNYNEILAYNHIIESTYVVLYNAKTDTNYFCDLVDSSVDNTKQKEKKYFECQLREIVNTTL